MTAYLTDLWRQRTIEEDPRKRTAFPLLAALRTTIVLLAAVLTHQELFAQPRAIVVNGTVADVDGQPVAEAEVMLQVPKPDKSNWLTNILLSPNSPSDCIVDPEDAAVVVARCDAAGRFRLRAPRPLAGADHLEGVVVWAYSPHHRIKYERIESLKTQPDPLRLVLPPCGENRIESPRDFRIRVFDGRNKPLTGASLTVTGVNKVWGRGTTSCDGRVPDPPLPLRARWTTITDGLGCAYLPTVGAVEARTIEVVHPSIGRQSCHVELWKPEDEVVQLSPVGKVRGRVVADRAEMVRGLNVSVVTAKSENSGPNRNLTTKSGAVVVTDAEGRFETPLLAEGRVFFAIPQIEEPENGKPTHLLVSERPKELRGGKTLEVELHLAPTVRVHGLLREQGTGKPLDATLFYTVERGSQDGDVRYSGLIKTDHAGRFEFYQLPGRAEVAIACGGTAACLNAWKETIPAGVKDLEIPPIEAVVVRGHVLDEAGDPVGSAELACSWRPPGALLEGNKHQGEDHLATGEDGTYSFWCHPGVEFRLKFSADNMVAQEVPWSDVRKLAGGRLPDIVLHRDPRLRRPIAGRVVDRQGRPVQGATVFFSAAEAEVDEDHQRYFFSCRRPGPVLTDAQGRFNLRWLPGETFPIFVRKEGFRFYGQWIQKQVERVEIVVARCEEPPLRRRPAIPLPLSLEKRIDLVIRIVDASQRRLMGTEAELRMARQMWLAELLALTPSEEARRLLKQRMPGGTPKRKGLAQALAEIAAEELGGIGDLIDYWHWELESSLRQYNSEPARWWLRFAATLPKESSHARRLACWLATWHVSAIKDCAQRLQVLGEIAESRLAAGETDAAGRLFRQGRTLVAGMPEGAWETERAEFAVRLAIVDLPAAKAMAEELCPAHQQLFLELAAERLARENPHQAERLMAIRSRGGYPTEIEAAARAVCKRIAPVDLPCATRIAQRMDDRVARGRILATMAETIAKTRAAGAKQLVEEAFASLETAAKWSASDEAASLAAELLPLVETLDAQLVEELFWRTVSLRQPPRDDEEPLLSEQCLSCGFQAEIRLAALLARYDRDVARAIFEPVLSRIPEKSRSLVLAEALVIDSDVAEAALRTPQIRDGILAQAEPAIELLLSCVYPSTVAAKPPVGILREDDGSLSLGRTSARNCDWR